MKRMIVLMSIAALVLTGCAADATRAQKGAGYGALGGAAIGAGIGAATGKGKGALLGAAIGAGVGAATGAGIGAAMDKQEADMRAELARSEAVNIQRNADVLQLTFKSDVMFDHDSATLKAGVQDEMARVARVLNQYPQTTILVAGHTDSTGSDAYNQGLSERRAEAARNALLAQGLSPARVNTVGYGKTRPIASNATPEGRQLNRRVEITITPNQQ